VEGLLPLLAGGTLTDEGRFGADDVTGMRVTIVCVVVIPGGAPSEEMMDVVLSGCVMPPSVLVIDQELLV
jgi:hypothetical protein